MGDREVDQQLVVRAQRGDKRAFELLVAKYQRKLGRLLSRLVRDPAQIAPALQRAREAVRRDGKSAVVNIWVDPSEYAPGTKAQTMYK